LGEAIVSGGNPAKVLEAPEHAFDRVAIAVEIGREAVLPAPVELGRDVGCGAAVLDLGADGVGIVALIAVQDFGPRHGVEQDIGGDAVCYLATGQQERDRAAETVGQGVDFGRPSAARATDRLTEFPPFPPAAQR